MLSDSTMEMFLSPFVESLHHEFPIRGDDTCAIYEANYGRVIDCARVGDLWATHICGIPVESAARQVCA